MTKRPTRAKVDERLAPRPTKGERTRAAIKQAIAELIAERQSLNFTLDDICAKTGLTIGAFYFHFENKDAAVEELAIDHIGSFYDSIVAQAAQLEFEALCRLILQRSIEACVRDPAMLRANYTLIPQSFPVYRAWVQSRQKLVSILLRQLAARRGRANAPSAAEAVDVHLLLSGLEGFLENLYFGEDSSMKAISKRPQKLEEELWAHWHAVLKRPAKVDPS